MRLRILSDDDIEALYGLPRFTDEERTEHFSLSPAENAALEQLRLISAKIYFILQMGYFKASMMFFVFEPREVEVALRLVADHVDQAVPPQPARFDMLTRPRKSPSSVSCHSQ